MENFSHLRLSSEMMAKIKGGKVTKMLCYDNSSGHYGYFFYNDQTGSITNIIGNPVSYTNLENCGCGPEAPQDC